MTISGFSANGILGRTWENKKLSGAGDVNVLSKWAFDGDDAALLHWGSTGAPAWKQSNVEHNDTDTFLNKTKNLSVHITIDMSLVCEQEVVQRLFDDQEDQQDPKATDNEPETPAEQPCPAQATAVRSELKPYRDWEETQFLAFIDSKQNVKQFGCLVSSLPPLDRIPRWRKGRDERGQQQ